MKKGVYGRYGIDFKKAVCQLVPYWLRGRGLVLYLQACVHPLQSVSDAFRQWADQTRIDVSMTSQTIMLEWYFKRMFGTASVKVLNYNPYNNPCFYRNSQNLSQLYFPCYRRSEAPDVSGSMVPILHSFEESDLGCSFVVSVPRSLEGKAPDIKRVVDKYKIANKTYKIEFQ